MNDTMSDPHSTLPRERVAEAVGMLWWLTLLRGVILLLLGGYVVANPSMSVIILTKVLGVYLILEGVIAIVAAILGETPSRGWTAARGLLLILVGIFVVGHSAVVAGIAATVVLTIIAVGAIISGVMDIVAAIQDRKEIEGEGWLILGGVLTVVFGVIVLMAPLTFGRVLVCILGIYAVFSGILLVILAFRIRGVGKVLKQPVDSV